jgi:hypothetical protein
MDAQSLAYGSRYKLTSTELCFALAHKFFCS